MASNLSSVLAAGSGLTTYQDKLNAAKVAVDTTAAAADVSASTALAAADGAEAEKLLARQERIAVENFAGSVSTAGHILYTGTEADFQNALQNLADGVYLIVETGTVWEVQGNVAAQKQSMVPKTISTTGEIAQRRLAPGQIIQAGIGAVAYMAAGGYSDVQQQQQVYSTITEAEARAAGLLRDTAGSEVVAELWDGYSANASGLHEGDVSEALQTANSVYLNALIQLARKRGAVSIRLPVGTYYVRGVDVGSSVLAALDMRDVSNVVLRGEGVGRTVLKVPPNRTTGGAYAKGQNLHFAQCFRTENLLVMDLTVEGGLDTVAGDRRTDANSQSGDYDYVEHRHAFNCTDVTNIYFIRVEAKYVVGDFVRMLRGSGKVGYTNRHIYAFDCRGDRFERSFITFREGTEHVYAVRCYAENCTDQYWSSEPGGEYDPAPCRYIYSVDCTWDGGRDRVAAEDAALANDSTPVPVMPNGKRRNVASAIPVAIDGISHTHHATSIVMINTVITAAATAEALRLRWCSGVRIIGGEIDGYVQLLGSNADVALIEPTIRMTGTAGLNVGVVHVVADGFDGDAGASYTTGLRIVGGVIEAVNDTLCNAVRVLGGERIQLLGTRLVPPAAGGDRDAVYFLLNTGPARCSVGNRVEGCEARGWTRGVRLVGDVNKAATHHIEMRVVGNDFDGASAGSPMVAAVDYNKSYWMDKSRVDRYPVIYGNRYGQHVTKSLGHNLTGGDLATHPRYSVVGGDAGGICQVAGYGAPGDSANSRPSVSAPPGSTYFDRDGGTGTTFYVKESGTDDQGWEAK